MLNEEELKDKAMSLMALELALEDMGIYPQSVTDGNGNTHNRTEWENGYNASTMELTNKWVEISNWLKTVPQEIKDYILEEKLHISIDGKNVTMYVNCNDVFAWACSDSEEFQVSDLEDFKKAYQESPKNGDILWAARNRKMRPQRPLYKYLNKEEHHLFDAVENE